MNSPDSLSTINNRAALAIILVNDKVLLTQRKDVPVWVLPGGGVEKGETAEEGCLREAHEETGFTITIVRKAMTLLPHSWLSTPTTLFVCRIASGEMRLSEECRDLQFFSLKDLPKNFFYLHKNWLFESLKLKEPEVRVASEITWQAFLSYLAQHPWIVIRFLGTRLSLFLRGP